MVGLGSQILLVCFLLARKWPHHCIKGVLVA